MQKFYWLGLLMDHDLKYRLKLHNCLKLTCESTGGVFL